MSKCKEVISKLKSLGWESLDAWSKAHGYERTHVHKTIKCWFSRGDGRAPYGQITIRIMYDLNETFAKKVTPKKWSKETDKHCDAYLHLCDTKFAGVEFIRSVDIDNLDRAFLRSTWLGDSYDFCFLIGA